MNKKIKLLAVAVLFSGQSIADDNTHDLVIEISSGLPQIKSKIQSKTSTVQASPTADGGELLKSLSGVSGIRMGGRAIDPVIRGQSQTQLNVLLDGAYIHNACPNRMDPPTAYTSVDSYDSVTVIKGNRSVEYGSGGPGGTVMFQRSWPIFDEKGYAGDVSSSYHGNGERYELGADIAVGNETGYMRAISHKGSSNNYRDGKGKKVRSSYESQTNSMLMGLSLDDATRLEASFEKAEEEDVLFAGASMDSPYADADTARVKLTHLFHSGALKQMKLEAYRSEIDHLMDNYSLRSAGGMLMQSPSISDTDGGRLVVDALLMDVDWKFGVDVQNNNRDAELQNQAGTVSRLLWPDAEIDQRGLFVEAKKAVNLDNVLRTGLRYDHVSAIANRRDEVNAGFSPQQIWAMAGAPAGAGEEKTEHNVGGFVNWIHRLDDQYTLDTVLSRSVRTADATERYMARTAMSGDWIGNPQLDPETHHQIEVSLQNKQDRMSWNVSGWYSRVDDYILRQSLAAGMKDRDVYRNVSAELYGAEFEMAYQLDSNWTLGNSVAWTVGNNLDDDHSLSRISPLELVTSIDYQRDKLTVGAEWQLVWQQNDICLSDSANCGGQDVRKTPGYGIMNLHAEYLFDNGISLLGGVDNLNDKAYTLHESREDVVNPGSFQVAEPGRSVWVRISKSF